MHPSSTDLYREFTRWEQLGRGELVWNQAVQPEPFFHPFIGHGNLDRKQREHDDGLIPSPLKRISNKLLGTNKTTTPPPLPSVDPLACLDSGDAPDCCHDYRNELVEFVLLVPDNQKPNSASFEFFLYALTPARFPLTFEIIASSNTITIEITADASDKELVANCLDSYLPELGVEVRTGFLQEQILQYRNSAVISRELALRREFVFPIATQKSGTDPYQSILSSLSHLSGSELAIIQINFQPCLNPWAGSVWRLVTQNDQITPIFENGGELLKAAQSKNNKPYVATTVRLAVLAPSEDEARYVARQLASAFQTYEGENGFVLADDDAADDTQRKVGLALRRFRRSGMLLNADEFLSLAHLPGLEVNAPKLLRLTERSHPAPLDTIRERPSKHDLVLGANIHKSRCQQVCLSESDRSRHMHVIGASGTGKSTFLLNSIIQDLKNGHGCALLDPHGDLVDGVLANLPENRIKDVVLFDPTDEDYPVGFNILSAHSEIEKNLLSSDFVSIFQRLSASWGDNMSAVLGNATLAMLENKDGGTLLDLRRFLVEPAFRTQFLENVEDYEVRYFWQYEFPLIRGTTQSSLVTRLNLFLRQKMIRHMVAQKGNRLNFGSIMDSKKIFLAPLSQGLIGEENSWLLGSMLVSKFYQTALARQEQQQENRTPYWLYIDEAHNFLTPSIASILSGARKYSLGLTLAHQELAQFGTRDTAVLSSIITNAHTRVCFRLGDQDARKLEEGFSHFDAESLRTLKIGQTICRIGGSDRDFNLEAYPPVKQEGTNDHIREQVLSHSRSSYGTPKEEVEELLKSNAPSPPVKAKKAAAKKASLPTPSKIKEKPSKPADSPEEPKQPPAEKIEVEKDSEDSSPQIPTLATSDVMPPATYHQLKKTAVQASGSAGRGGALHKSLQQLIKRHANGLGLIAHIEYHLPDNSGAVDVLIENESHQIAFEVALHSPIEQEVKNIRKSLDAGIGEIVVISDNSTHLDNIQTRALEESISLDKVTFMDSDSLGEYFSKLAPSIPNEGVSVQGYKIETIHTSMSDEEKESRDNAINKSIAENIQELDSD